MAPVRYLRRLVLILALGLGLFLLVFRNNQIPIHVPDKFPETPALKNILPGGPKKKPFSWSTVPVNYPDTDRIPLPKSRGGGAKLSRIQHRSLTDAAEETPARLKQRQARLQAVKDVFRRSWDSYRHHAWMHDEVRPVSGGSTDPFGGWAATLVDSLDTLWIMGMKSEFEQAIAALEKIDFSRSQLAQLSLFETTIRFLGGFLGAHDITEGRYPILLKKATELGEMLYHAFDTPNHMPVARWDWREAKAGIKQEADAFMLIAELGSLSMEFTRLAQLTNDSKFFSAVQRISLLMHAKQDSSIISGMWPVTVNPRDESFSSDSVFTWGGMSDSAYEYLPKMHLLLAGHDDIYGEMWKNASTAAKTYLAFEPTLPKDSNPAKGLRPLFLGTAKGRWTQINDGPEQLRVDLVEEGQHLACFAGGAFALASRALSSHADEQTAAEDLSIGGRLTDGCVWSYRATQTGIGPELFATTVCRRGLAAVSSGRLPDWTGEKGDPDCRWTEKDSNEARESGLPLGFVSVLDPRYLLRPEAIESVFVMWRLTGDTKWVDAAWDMFEAVSKHTRSSIGYAGLESVLSVPPSGSGKASRKNKGKAGKSGGGLLDTCESFWTAETLKYFFLVFSDPSVVNLDEYVLNTEAHPFRYRRGGVIGGQQ